MQQVIALTEYFRQNVVTAEVKTMLQVTALMEYSHPSVAFAEVQNILQAIVLMEYSHLNALTAEVKTTALQTAHMVYWGKAFHRAKKLIIPRPQATVVVA